MLSQHWRKAAGFFPHFNYFLLFRCLIQCSLYFSLLVAAATYHICGFFPPNTITVITYCWFYTVKLLQTTSGKPFTFLSLLNVWTYFYSTKFYPSCIVACAIGCITRSSWLVFGEKKKKNKTTGWTHTLIAKDVWKKILIVACYLQKNRAEQNAEREYFT